MNTEYFKKAIPHVFAVAIFLALTLIYVSPVLEGKRIFQSDIMKFKGMSKEIVDFREKTGEEPLWTNSMFGGMPAYQISVLYKNNISRYFHKVLTMGLPRPADMIFLYFIGFYILLLVLRINPWLAILGAIAFAFSSYHFIIIEAGHNSKAVAIAYMAPVLAGIIVALRGHLLKGGLLTAIFLGLQINANHYQITYYLLYIVLAVGIGWFIYALNEKQLKQFFSSIGVLILALVLALTLNFSNLITTWEYSKYTIRGGSELSDDLGIQTPTGLDKDYATRWSYGIAETFSLFIPNIKGGSSQAITANTDALNKIDRQYHEWVGQQSHYWGEQPFTSGPVYVGAIIFFLFVFGVFIVKGYLKWAMLAATLLSIILAWGHNFMPLTDFFLDHVPGYNKFRAVSMTLVIAGLCIPLLALLALKEILSKPAIVKVKLNEFLLALGFTAGLSLVFYIAPGLFFNFITSQEMASMQEFKLNQPDMAATVDLLLGQLEKARIGILKADAIRSFLFIALSAVLIYLFHAGKIKQNIFIMVLALLILADMWTVNRRYLNNDNFVNRRQVERPFQPTVADQVILKDTDPHFRVLNLTTNTFNETATSYFHKSIGGYHGAKLQRYQDLIDHHIIKGNTTVIDMLNAKYIINSDQNRRPSAQVNFNATGNAWFLNRYKEVANADEEIAALNDLDPELFAVVDERFADHYKNKDFEHDPEAFINLNTYAPNRLTYDASTATQQIAVFSEVYYDKGWNAYLNGEPWPHFRVNYILRAMIVPAGSHEIEFRFEPRSYYLGEKISLAGSILIGLLIMGFILQEIRKILNAHIKSA
jgi:hypothetical protein